MSTFNELIDFTRSTTGTYLDSVVYGDDKANAFAGSGGATWTVVDKNTVSGTQPSDLAYFTAIVSGLTIGAQYKIELTITNYAGSDNLGIGSSGGIGSTVRLFGNGTKTSFFTATEVSLDAFMRSSNSGTINVSVKEVIGGQVSGTPLLRTAAINEPRLEYDASGNPLGLLIEEARTNLCPFSESFTSTWVHNNSTLNSGIDSPDGGDNAWSITENTQTSTHQVYYPSLINSTGSGQSFNFSVYVKQLAGNRRIQLAFTGSAFGGEAYATFNINSKAIFTNAAMDGQATIQPVGNGWYRVSASATTNAAATASVVLRMWNADNTGYALYAGDGVSTLGIHGAQLEAGAFPTSYIPTSGSAVTRAADIASLPVERFAYNQPQGSIVCHFHYFFEQGDSKRAYEFSDSTDNNVIRMLDHGDVNKLQAQVKSGDSGVAGILINAPTMLSGVKTFQTYKLNGYSGGADGTLAGTDENGALPVGINKLNIGSRRDGGVTMSGHITSLQYYPKKLTNTELQLLTQPSASPTMNLTFDGQATSTLVEGLHD